MKASPVTHRPAVTCAPDQPNLYPYCNRRKRWRRRSFSS
jgi:hypothetical protein